MVLKVPDIRLRDLMVLDKDSISVVADMVSDMLFLGRLEVDSYNLMITVIA